MERPAHIAPDRWREVLADADRLLMWVPMLEAMSWTPEDTFGRDDLDHLSVVQLMRGQKVSAITEDAVILRGPNYETTCIYRRGE